MLLIALRDLQFRRRRYLISVVAVALVFALTLMLSAISASFDAEITRTLQRLKADRWVVAAGASGPFLGAVPMTSDQLGDIASQPGIEQASPVAFFTLTLDDAHHTGVSVFGVEPTGVGAPVPDQGRPVEADDEIVVSKSLGVDVGEQLTMGGQTFEVVGTMNRSSLLGGSAVAVLTLSVLQQLAFKGAPVISTIAVRGSPSNVPAGYVLMTNGDAHADLLRPLVPARDTINFISVVLWIVAACIVGSVIYLSALERVGDFAVFKATGMSTSWMLAGLVLQAVLLAALASVVAIVLAQLVAPRLPVPGELSFGLLLFMPVTALVVSALASLFGVRRAVRVDPALAFG